MFYVNDEPEGKLLYTETTKLYCKTDDKSRLRLTVKASHKTDDNSIGNNEIHKELCNINGKMATANNVIPTTKSQYLMILTTISALSHGNNKIQGESRHAKGRARVNHVVLAI